MRRYLTILLFFCIVTDSINAGKLKYAGQYLQKAVACLQIDTESLDTVVEADTLMMVNGMPLHLRIHEGRLEHIGWHLFSRDARLLSPSPVYDYLEYGCLDNHLHLSEDPFVYKNVVFQQGSWDVLTRITEKIPCDITLLESKAYQVVWQDDKTSVDVVFPVGYERLYMVTRRELEKRFLDDLENYAEKVQVEMPRPRVEDMQLMADSIYCLPGDFYQLTSINRNLYFQKDKRLGMVLIWDKKHPAESMANLCVSNDGWLNNFPLELGFTTYDREKRTIKVPIGHLLSLGNETGCKAYFGVEKLENDSLTIALFLYNQAYGFDHVFHISCNPQLMEREGFSLSGRGALYVPTTNVSTLFSTRTGKSSPKKLEQ